MLAFCCPGINENTSTDQIPVKICNHGTYVSRGIWPVRGIIVFLAVAQILFHSLGKINIIGFVDGINIAMIRIFHIRMAKDE
jgi:hypothetical protein